jgi:hypothetical protein
MGRFAAKLKAKRAALGKTKIASTYLISTMKSSWVEYYEWVPEYIGADIGDFYMQVKGGKKYEWKNISRDDAGQAVGGNATCTTDDPTGLMRWRKDKHPSLGAAYHQICKFFITRGYAPIGAGAYDSIFEDTVYTKSKEEYFKQKGRPSDRLRNWKRGLDKPWATKKKVHA